MAQFCAVAPSLAVALLALSSSAVGCRADVSSSPEAAASSPAPNACGRPPLHPCPLQQWMDFTLAPAFRQGRLERLVAPLEQLATMAPAEFPTWKEIALGGATAAARGDHGGVRRSCGGCHDAYREQYRALMRSRPLVASAAAGGAR